jgi:hypothetical protein
MKVINMTDTEWETKFKPIKNHIDSNSSWEGSLFESYGKELDFVREKCKENPQCIWTLMDSEEDDDCVIVEGFHFVNRIGYFITENPAETNVKYIVKD